MFGNAKAVAELSQSRRAQRPGYLVLILALGTLQRQRIALAVDVDRPCHDVEGFGQYGGVTIRV